MPSEYARKLGARLRAIRAQQGLSLTGVEEKSRGRWKAVVVGSYERGDRGVTVEKLALLAEFYGVPVTELIPGDVAPPRLEPLPKLVIDLQRLSHLPADTAGPLARYVAAIQNQRHDYGGRVLSVRHEDLRALAVIYDKSPADLIEDLIRWGVLDVGARAAVGAFLAVRPPVAVGPPGGFRPPADWPKAAGSVCFCTDAGTPGGSSSPAGAGQCWRTVWPEQFPRAAGPGGASPPRAAKGSKRHGTGANGQRAGPPRAS